MCGCDGRSVSGCVWGCVMGEGCVCVGVGVRTCAHEAKERRKTSEEHLLSSYHKPSTVPVTLEAMMIKTHCLHLPRMY